MRIGERSRVGIVFLFGMLYLAFELFEDLFNIWAPFDEFFGLGLALLAYVLLIRWIDKPSWQAWVTTVLLSGLNAFDWLSPSGARWDELITVVILTIVFILLFWPFLKRVRLSSSD